MKNLSDIYHYLFSNLELSKHFSDISSYELKFDLNLAGSLYKSQTIILVNGKEFLCYETNYHSIDWSSTCIQNAIDYHIKGLHEYFLSRGFYPELKSFIHKNKSMEQTTAVQNFGWALEAMKEGKKVKLPEWTGYWFMENGEIKVLTNNGEVTNTPWIDKFKDRTDWDITQGKLGFDFAIRALKNGKKVTRAGWNGKGMYLWLLPATIVKKEWVKDPMLLDVFGEKEELFCLGSIRMKTATGDVLTGWLASQSDMLAEDWEIVK